MTQPKRLSQEHESALLKRLRERDETALAELYDLLAPWVLGLAARILRDQTEAEEVLSDVFTQVWSHVEQHDPGRGTLVPWVLSITRNRALDGVRRRRRWWRKADRWGQAKALDAELGLGDAAPHEAAVPGWPVHTQVHAALASLPEEQRRVVVLAYFERSEEHTSELQSPR